jgi:ADP-ribose pyrophosphatase
MTSKRAKVLKSSVVFKGPLFSVRRDIVTEPAGYTVRRDVVVHPGSVVVLAMRDGRSGPEVLLERQYRHAIGDFMWELPAGKVDAGEQPLQAAKRELLEETGFRAKRWKKMLGFYVSPGFVNERMNVFLATDLRAGEAQPEADEAIEVRFVPLKRTIAMAESGTIRDAKTLASLFWVALRYIPTGRSSSSAA